MRRRATRPVALVWLVAAVIAGALLCGCGGSGGDLHSEVPGIELVHTPGPEAAWSPDGGLIASIQGRWIDFERADGTAAGRVQAPRLVWESSTPEPLRFSADGRRLFYVTIVGPAGNDAVKATQVPRDGGVTQTSLGTRYADASFAAHGWPLVYATGPYEFGPDGEREGPPAGIWKLAGPGVKPQRLLRVAGIPWEPVVGEHTVLFKQSLRKKTELWAVGLDGSAPHRLARFTYLRRYAFAPHGKDIAFAATPRLAHTYLYLLAGGRGRPRRVGSAEVLDGPVWSPDGRWLVFSTPRGQIRRIHPDGSGGAAIAEASGEEIEWLAFSPDGRRLLYGARRPDEGGFLYGGTAPGEGD